MNVQMQMQNKRERLREAKKAKPAPDLTGPTPVNEKRLPAGPKAKGKRSKGWRATDSAPAPKKPAKNLPLSDAPPEVKELLRDLRDASDPDEKKSIRRKLRARGWRGGLREDAGHSPKGKVVVKSKKKAVAEDLDEDEIEEIDDE